MENKMKLCEVIMTVNQLMAKLRQMQKQGHGKVAVHMIAHDNYLGESQGEVGDVYYYTKAKEEREVADHTLFDSTPNEMVYLGP
jgi:hypothetical protein